MIMMLTTMLMKSEEHDGGNVDRVDGDDEREELLYRNGGRTTRSG